MKKVFGYVCGIASIVLMALFIWALVTGAPLQLGVIGILIVLFSLAAKHFGGW